MRNESSECEWPAQLENGPQNLLPLFQIHVDTGSRHLSLFATLAEKSPRSKQLSYFYLTSKAHSENQITRYYCWQLLWTHRQLTTSSYLPFSS